MAMIGSTIGLTFAFSLVAGPLLYQGIGMAGLFALTGILALAAIGVVSRLVPAVVAAPPKRAGPPPWSAVRDAELVRLNIGIFVLHIILYAMFVVVPLQLVESGLELSRHWLLYLPVVLLSFVAMIPPILYADRRNRPKPVLVGSITLLLAVEAGLSLASPGVAGYAVAMLSFFVAFNVLEALLPALVSRAAPARGRGLVIGVYNTTQTLGVFFGGLIGGWAAKRFGSAEVFALCAVLAGIWLVLAAGMKPPARPA
jgi:predicted MFS family arabinose efflux permease